MKFVLFRLLNYSIFIFVTMVLLGLQSTLWRQLFGAFAAPQTWIPVFVYWALYRTFRSGMLMTYLMVLMLSAMSATAIGTQICILSILFGLIHAFRMRIYYSGALFFMLVCGGATFSYPIIHTLVSWVIEANPITSVAFLTWVISTLLTMLLSLGLFHILVFVDHLTRREASTDITGELT